MVTFEERLAEYMAMIETEILSLDSSRLNSGNRRHILELLDIHDRCGKLLDRAWAVRSRSVPSNV